MPTRRRVDEPTTRDEAITRGAHAADYFPSWVFIAFKNNIPFKSNLVAKAWPFQTPFKPPRLDFSHPFKGTSRHWVANKMEKQKEREDTIKEKWNRLEIKEHWTVQSHQEEWTRNPKKWGERCVRRNANRTAPPVCVCIRRPSDVAAVAFLLFLTDFTFWLSAKRNSPRLIRLITQIRH